MEKCCCYKGRALKYCTNREIKERALFKKISKKMNKEEILRIWGGRGAGRWE